MAVVRVRRDDFAESGLPAVCVLTGEHAQDSVPARGVRLPPWIWLLLAAGFIPFLISLFLSVRIVEGTVPMSRHTMERVATLQQASRVTSAAGGLLLFAWMLASWRVLGLLAAAALVLALGVWLARRDHTPGVRLRGDEVVLSGVHPRFAAAVRQQYASSQPSFPLREQPDDVPGDSPGDFPGDER